MTGRIAATSLADFVQARAASGRPLALAELFVLFTPVAQALIDRIRTGRGPFSSSSATLSPKSLRLTGAGTNVSIELLDPDDGFVLERDSAVQPGPRFSFAHAAPEQWSSDRYGAPSPATDVWGLALTLAEVCSGRQAASGDRSELMARLLDPAQRPTPAALGVSTSRAVEAAFARGRANVPTERFSDVAAFWGALGKALSRAAGAAPSDSGEVLSPSSFEIPDLELSPAPPSKAAVSAPLPLSPRASGRSPVSAASGWDGELDAAPSAHQGSIELDDQWLGGDPLEAFQAPRPRAAPRASSPPAPLQAAPAPRANSEPPLNLPRTPSVPPVLPSNPSALSLAERLEPVVNRAVDFWIGVRDHESWFVRAAPAFALVAFSIALTLLDQAYAAIANDKLSFGPIRPRWIAATCFVGGLAWSLARALRRPS
jgi:hypothetical protein